MARRFVYPATVIDRQSGRAPESKRFGEKLGGSVAYGSSNGTQDGAFKAENKKTAGAEVWMSVSCCPTVASMNIQCAERTTLQAAKDPA